MAEELTTAAGRDRVLEELAAAGRDGDTRARDELLRMIEPDVMRITARVLPYRLDAEEAAQDALLRIASNLHRFEGRSKFTTWMYTIASNSGRQTYRGLKRRAQESTTDTPVDKVDPRTTSVIAAQLGIPVGTAKSRVHDARVRLRRRLTR